MARRHHQCKDHDLGQAPGDGEAQGGLACCSPWGQSQTQLGDWTTMTQMQYKQCFVLFFICTFSHVI